MSDCSGHTIQHCLCMRMTVMMPMLPMRMFNYRPILQYMRMCLLFLGHNIPLSLSEYPILYQAPNEIFVKIERIVMEYHDNAQGNHTQLRTYLQQQGYQVQITPNFVHSDLGYLYACRA